MFWIIQGFAFSKNENTVKFSQHQNRTGCNLIFNFVVVVILEDSLVYFKAVCLQEWSKKKKKSGSRKTSAINITGYLSKNAIFRAPVHPVSTENHWVVFLFNACSSLGTTALEQ